MSINVDWLDGTGRQIVHFHQKGTWTWEEYDAAVDDIIEMMEMVPHFVTVLVDLTGAVTSTRSKDAYTHFRQAMDRWQEVPNYAQFFMVLNPSYWSRITLFLIERVTQTPLMMAVTSVEDAIERGLLRIENLSANNSGQPKLSDTP